MIARIVPHVFSGTVKVPASKSHTIRRLLMAGLTGGVSYIENPLDSLDSRSCAAACRALGAEIEKIYEEGKPAVYRVHGRKPGGAPANDSRSAGGGADSAQPVIDVGNSGTTLFLALAAAALGSAPVIFTGDEQIARRSAAPLLNALRGLGVETASNSGYTPITVCGPWKGGEVSVSCPTSQYLSALLITAPLAPAGTVTGINVPLLNEKPYVEMTLSYLRTQGLYGAEFSNTANVIAAPDFSRFRVAGGAAYTPINGPVPGDFSSAAFPAAAAVISGGAVTLLGLDPGDTQGDKAFFGYLRRMGCEVRWERLQAAAGQGVWQVKVSRSGSLRGGIFDLNAVPDMLPVMAALGVYAEGTTELINAAHARIKETDRIAVMAAELGKLGVHCGIRCEERPDGLVIHGGTRSAAADGRAGPVRLDGHGDHRVVMALACAALGADQPVEINGTEAADVTYPGFLELLDTWAENGGQGLS